MPISSSAAWTIKIPRIEIMLTLREEEEEERSLINRS